MNIKSILSVIFPSPPAIKDLQEQQLKVAQEELLLLGGQELQVELALEHCKYRRMELEARIQRLAGLI